MQRGKRTHTHTRELGLLLCKLANSEQNEPVTQSERALAKTQGRPSQARDWSQPDGAAPFGCPSPSPDCAFPAFLSNSCPQSREMLRPEGVGWRKQGARGWGKQPRPSLPVARAALHCIALGLGRDRRQTDDDDDDESPGAAPGLCLGCFSCGRKEAPLQLWQLWEVQKGGGRSWRAGDPREEQSGKGRAGEWQSAPARSSGTLLEGGGGGRESISRALTWTCTCLLATAVEKERDPCWSQPASGRLGSYAAAAGAAGNAAAAATAVSPRRRDPTEGGLLLPW